MNTWCHFIGGPIDGDCLSIAPYAHTQFIVIYQSGAEPGKAGRVLDHPAVYVRDDAPPRLHRWTGADGVRREGGSQGYVFHRTVPPHAAADLEERRRAEMRGQLSDGGAL